MKPELLPLLRCPFCGGRLHLEPHPAAGSAAGEIALGRLFCLCCAYPIVAGIPYLRAGASARAALRWIGEDRPEYALGALLGAPDSQPESLQAVLNNPRLTFRDALSALSLQPEADYLFYRFSDPTYLCSEGVLRVLGGRQPGFQRAVLDLCGGTGHLTRVLCGRQRSAPVLLADADFRKLWLARRFIAPTCQPVCCDANEPLPFARESCSLVVCSDAFHYLWKKRLAADEMLRLVGSIGTILLAHLHNSQAENESAGAPLAPAAYRELFADCATRIWKESVILESLLTLPSLNLADGWADEQLEHEPSLLLLASRVEAVFRRYDLAHDRSPGGSLQINPLYQVERRGDAVVLTLQFPSPEYEAEYAACKRYLPARVELAPQQLAALEAGRADESLSALAKQRVLLELPQNYV